ncbi:MAG TPA: hypothetical protein IAB90_05785 [Candidatus Coproplasma stercoripullorum]|uniref:Uncharacterized protein n=1 Tax=Candidatus Coproplasma stercoripullorum TaxID=2840751 RepID=A0A9D1AGM4_9FIRM|nr:hypothetical protein [Candidatus Coproplasma stercoripullorum]
METAEITDLPFIVFGVTLLLWIISAIVTLALWLSFRSAYKRILNSPARADEMPQVASYRQKVKADKKSTFRKLWWRGWCSAFAPRRAYADIEKRQKAELETNPAYARNLEWYKLYENFSKFKGKVYIIFIAAGIVLGWVLAALFPSSVWSLFMLAPIIAGLLINNALVKDLRKNAIPIEREIDAAECARVGEEIQL